MARATHRPGSSQPEEPGELPRPPRTPLLDAVLDDTDAAFDAKFPGSTPADIPELTGTERAAARKRGEDLAVKVLSSPPPEGAVQAHADALAAQDAEPVDEADENAAEDPYAGLEVNEPDAIEVLLTAAQARVVRWMVTALSGLGYAEVLDDAGEGEVVDLAGLSDAITAQLGDGR